MVADVALFGVVGGDQQRPAGVAEAEAFPFHLVFAGAHRGQQKIDDAVIEQVELIDVQHSSVSFCEQPRLEHRAAAGQ